MYTNIKSKIKIKLKHFRFNSTKKALFSTFNRDREDVNHFEKFTILKNVIFFF